MEKYSSIVQRNVYWHNSQVMKKQWNKQTNASKDFKLFAKEFILTVAARTALRNSNFNNIIWTKKIVIRACKSELAKNVLELHDIKGFVLRKSRALFKSNSSLAYYRQLFLRRTYLGQAVSKSDVYLITSQLKAVLLRCSVKKESTLYFNDIAVVLYARISRHSVLLHP